MSNVYQGFHDETNCVLVCLARYPDINVEVFEAAKEFSEVGAGIGVWPRIWKTLASLGLDEDLARLHAVRPTYESCKTPLKLTTGL